MIPKDIDLKLLQDLMGQPSKIIHLTIGNSSNMVVRRIISKNIDFIIESLIMMNKPYLEITD